ncbi:hypothetical protein M9H77_26628 [Catharanthus roseus]|uniref:Uncharacterized protein n=1 Tax=Catharanthus roseus TaxID=4058 RepID=A0ACC0AAD3_CATRO|nr:hypothetical protein M9H77_26628 [Catharanthus roseus]
MMHYFLKPSERYMQSRTPFDINGFITFMSKTVTFGILVRKEFPPLVKRLLSIRDKLVKTVGSIIGVIDRAKLSSRELIPAEHSALESSSLSLCTILTQCVGRTQSKLRGLSGAATRKGRYKTNKGRWDYRILRLVRNTGNSWSDKAQMLLIHK